MRAATPTNLRHRTKLSGSRGLPRLGHGVPLDVDILETIERAVLYNSFGDRGLFEHARDLIALHRDVNARVAEVAVRIGAGVEDLDHRAAWYLAAVEAGVEVEDPAPELWERVTALWTPSQKELWEKAREVVRTRRARLED